MSGFCLKSTDLGSTEFRAGVFARQNPAIYAEEFRRYGPGSTVMPSFYAEFAQEIEEFQVRNEDVWVASMIKSGTTWTQEMVWLLNNNLDYERAKVQLPVRFPYFEFDAAYGLNLPAIHAEGMQNSMQKVGESTSPRHIKTHQPFSLLPRQIRDRTKTPKIIYVARNPRDMAVSYFHHRRLIEGYLGTLDDHIDEFVNDATMYSPYWTHIKEYWDVRDWSNVLFTTYEEMKKDLKSVVEKCVQFLEKPKLSDSEMSKILQHLSFESMKSNEYVNYDDVTEFLGSVHGIPRQTHFMRKGVVGSWKEELSPDGKEKLDKWIKKNGFSGPFENI